MHSLHPLDIMAIMGMQQEQEFFFFLNVNMELILDCVLICPFYDIL